MTGNKCLLDTSVVIHIFKRHNKIAGRLDAISEVFVPVTVIGELFYGAYRSNNPSGHIIQVQSFLQNCKILLADSATADIYGNNTGIHSIRITGNRSICVCKGAQKFTRRIYPPQGWTPNKPVNLAIAASQQSNHIRQIPLQLNPFSPKTPRQN